MNVNDLKDFNVTVRVFDPNQGLSSGSAVLPVAFCCMSVELVLRSSS